MNKTYGQLDKMKLQAHKLRKQVQSSTDLATTIQSRFIAAGLLAHQASATRIQRFSLAKYLDLLAYESGQPNWAALAAKTAQATTYVFDEATALYHPRQSEGALNIWCKDYAEAKAYLQKHAGLYLLHYRQSIFLARADHIQELGLDPHDADWDKMGYDWVEPKDVDAKYRLLEKLKQVDSKRHDRALN